MIYFQYEEKIEVFKKFHDEFIHEFDIAL